MFSGMLAGFLKVAAVAVVTGGVAVALLAAACGGGEGSSAFVQGESSVTVTITPESTAAPPTRTATALPPTQPPPTAPPATDVPPAPTADTRVSMGPPRADLIQLGKDGKYFVADRGDGCTWVEYLRDTRPEIGLRVFLRTDCPTDFGITFRPESGLVLPLVS